MTNNPSEMMLMKRSPNSLTRRLLFAVALPILFGPGCVGDSKMSEKEKAALIKEKRQKANDLLKMYEASDSQDFDSLEKCMELHRETTEIAPQSCPRCWAEYGQALSYLGYHYWFLFNDVEREIRAASPAQREKLEEEADEYREEWKRYFEDSNKAYETHFRSPDVTTVHPYSYERVMRHYEILGNYDRALFYLGKFEESYPLIGAMDESVRQRVEKLRRLYKSEARRDRERQVKGVKGPPPPPVSMRGAEPAKKASRKKAAAPPEEEE
jgi:tetratricopeptide (TPR) repeat protein